ncbi:porphobilinogen synthase [Paludicola sp. MB14-C6]|uniref:porphobilinogen synthase n=1 Tax=Paludihabitans sp. MB14-C6 TaxID=3070656 RepID=UPI0027DD6BDD|nr:porphobilinogen synthase [Paludicola sp. MB14-C6]WMJ22039.1 porphobilinogen synthase [Paludicola sp. MB14-C6]
MLQRARRLRVNKDIRDMARETRVSKNTLILPMFLKEGKNIKDEISSLDHHYHYSPDRIFEGIEEGLKAGVNKFLLFGLPNHKDEVGCEAYSDSGIVQQGLRAIKDRYKDEVYLITDICMCEYTSHGHCGILQDEYVNNDKTLEYLAEIAVSHANAGADMVAPSDMMDGRILSMRNALDQNGYTETPIMSYAVKYASSFYGPFRAAADSAPSFGDRKSYQMDYHNIKEGLKEAKTDEQEGADIIMVKPAMSYLDVIKKVSENTNLPVAAYSVSGEYAMIKAAAKMGLINEYGVMCESAISIYRAGADILITYFAKELAEAMRKGDIG